MSAPTHELERLSVKVLADNTHYMAGMEAVEDRAARASQQLMLVGAGLTLGTTLPLAAMAYGFVNAASNAEETASKFNAVFRGINDDATEAANVLTNEYGMSLHQAQGMLADTADMLTGFGIDKSVALDMSATVQQLATDLASFQNLEGGSAAASEALTKGLLGERDSMKSLGIAILDADVKARMLEHTQRGLTYESERQAMAAATLELAIEQSGNALGDYARTSDGFANQTRELGADLSTLAVQFGRVLLPAAQAALAVVRGWVQWLIELSNTQRTVIVVLSAMVAAIGPVLFAIGAMGQASVWAASGLRAVVSTLQAVRIAAMAAWATAAWPVLIVAAIGAAIAGVVYWVVGPEGLANAWATVRGAAERAWGAIVGFTSNWRANMAEALRWFTANWGSLLGDAGRLLLAFTRIGFRLWAAFTGWLVASATEAIHYLFQGEWVGAITQWAITGLQVGVKWVTSMVTTLAALAPATLEILSIIPTTFFNILSKIGAKLSTYLMDALAGNAPSLGPVVADMMATVQAEMVGAMVTTSTKVAGAVAPLAAEFQKFGDQLRADYIAGGTEGIGETAARILEEEMAGVFQTEAPNFNWGDGVAAQLEEVVNAAEAVKEKVEEPMVLSLNSQSVEAVRSGTLAALDRLAVHQSVVAKQGAAPEAKKEELGELKAIAQNTANMQKIQVLPIGGFASG
jgi:hypothetical protein